MEELFEVVEYLNLNLRLWLEEEQTKRVQELWLAKLGMLINAVVSVCLVRVEVGKLAASAENAWSVLQLWDEVLVAELLNKGVELLNAEVEFLEKVVWFVFLTTVVHEDEATVEGVHVDLCAPHVSCLVRAKFK